MNAINELESAVSEVKPRAFDIYALGPLLIYAAFAGKKPLPRWPRRALFVAGCFTIIYNIKAYREAVAKVKETL